MELTKTCVGRVDQEEAERCRGRVLPFSPLANCDFMYDLPEHESGKVPSLQDPNCATLLLSCAQVQMSASQLRQERGRMNCMCAL